MSQAASPKTARHWRTLSRVDAVLSGPEGLLRGRDFDDGVACLALVGHLVRLRQLLLADGLKVGNGLAHSPSRTDLSSLDLLQCEGFAPLHGLQSLSLL